MYYVVHYELCTIFFMLILLVVSAIKRNFGDYQSRIFRIYLIVTLVDLILDVVTCYTVHYYKIIPLWINYLLNTVFLVLQLSIPTLFTVYLHYNTSDFRDVTKRLLWAVFVSPAIGLVLLLSNVWTGLIFYFDENGYQHGVWHWFLYANAIYCAMIAIISMLTSSSYMKRKQKYFVVAIMIVAMLPTLVQLALPNYMLSGVGAALSVFMIYMMNENVTGYIDQTTGALNREALVFRMAESRNKRMYEQFFVIALDNFKIVNEMYGMDGGNEIMRTLVDDLQKRYSESAVFRFGGDIFVVVIEERTEGAKELDRIRKIISKKRYINNEIVELSACVGLVHSIHHNDEELFHAIEYAISSAKQMGKGQFYEVDEDGVTNMLKRTAIEQAIVAALESHTFEVHYQPIYDVEQGRFRSMEALARLRVDGFGYVSPDEFIPIAEQNGTIMAIGLLVLEETCQFIRQYNLKKMGIDYVEVNLSTVQCMQESIYQDIMTVLHRYNIPPHMINLEITESAAAYSDDLLTRNMARISLTDITFSLDDYGSGYSNVNYLVDLPFSIVKIDKYLIWAAMKKVTSRKVLENMIKMFKAIDLEVVAEGIEDKEMLDMVKNLGVDYIQGYFFSKPVPKERIVDRLNQEYVNKILCENA